ncbi:MAG: hypothetical protein ACFE0Q_19010 [Anaerolineae bacterium]
MTRDYPLWSVRLLLALLMAFGSEIILWASPTTYGALDWAVRLLAYPLLATLMLDLAQRYRIRDGYDAMVLIAGTSLVQGLLINPRVSWQVLPDSLLTHIIGSQALVLLIVWAVFLAWLRGDRRKYALYQLVAGLWLGMYWGFIMRWQPELRDAFVLIPLTDLLFIAGVPFALIVSFYGLLTASFADDLHADHLLLTPIGWGVALMGIIVIFLLQTIQGAITASAFLLTVALLALCWLILWLRRDVHETSLLEQYLPVTRQFPLWSVLMMLVFAGALMLAYRAPLVTDLAFINQLWLMEIGSFAVGILWLPLVATVIATRAIDRSMRQGWTL